MDDKQRADLIQERNQNFREKYDFGRPKCEACGCDVVAYYGYRYATADISGCPKCHRSWCD